MTSTVPLSIADITLINPTLLPSFNVIVSYKNISGPVHKCKLHIFSIMNHLIKELLRRTYFEFLIYIYNRINMLFSYLGTKSKLEKLQGRKVGPVILHKVYLLHLPSSHCIINKCNYPPPHSLVCGQCTAVCTNSLVCVLLQIYSD